MRAGCWRKAGGMEYVIPCTQKSGVFKLRFLAYFISLPCKMIHPQIVA
jgi:hypothetical protein